MGACNIFKTKNQYKIITESETEDGFLLGGDPVFVISENDVAKLKAAVFESLRSSRRNVPTPKRDQYSVFEKYIMSKVKEKSYTALYKESTRASLRLDGDVLKIWPLKFLTPGKPNNGLALVEEDVIEIGNAPNRMDEVTSSIIDILNKKYD